MSLRKAAIISGISLIIMAIVAGFSYGYAHSSLVVPGDISTTYQNIASSILLFKAEIVGWVVILILDVIVAWSFYIFLKPVNQELALLASWLRLTYAAILGIAILNLVFVLLLSNDASLANQLQADITLYLEAFEVIWSVGLIVFGLHLLVVGWIAFQSSSIPKIISSLLVIAAIGYMVIHLGKTLLIEQNIIATMELIFNIPMIAGELGFGLWLLFKGGKVTIKS
ncbi:DUF4386 domain-containing protein [Psychrobacillus antarcticus]|uniref:DUF4386 domain-containing protein n=1 Tax=Psychrobacillus antarcticus TaxID=2879115 RepID=UPI00240799B7|nr:DUF4386 domain-containing protein [Psychrobacillus antarcticus]